MNVRRWRRAGVTALPIWDLPLDGGLLWERLGVPRVEALRVRGLAELEIGNDLAASAAATIRRQRERHGFSRAYVAGGLTLIAGFAESLASERDVVLDADGRFAGERGGLALLREIGHERGAVVDVGQVGVKASSGGRRLVKERDPRVLPFELIDKDRPPRATATRAGAAAGFVGDVIAELVARTQPTGLVLALPCPVDDDCVPGPCTYGWEGEAGLVPAILERCGLEFEDVLVLNDAELAAETALARGDGAAATFVMTVGFGPGGALVG